VIQLFITASICEMESLGSVIEMHTRQESSLCSVPQNFKETGEVYKW